MKMRILFYSILAVAIVFVTWAYADNGIVVSDAWVQAMPASATTTAAYMTITNNSPDEMILTSASSDIAGATEIHHMNDAKGMMHMAMVAALHISPGDKVIFAPGGFHIMLINLKKSLNAGDMVTVVLHFKDGSTNVVNAQVKSPQEQDSSSSMAGMKM